MTPKALAALRRFSPRTPLAPPPDLTLPKPRSGTSRDLLNRYIAAILRDFLTLPAAKLPRPQALELARTQEIVAELAISQAGAIVSLVRRPTFSVLVRCLSVELSRQTGPGAEQLAAELVETTLLELSLMGALAETVALDRPLERLCSQLHDFALDFEVPAISAKFSSREIELCFSNGETFILRAGEEPKGSPAVRVERPFPRILASASLALRDNNPLSHFEAHPDKDGNAINLGNRSIEDWALPLRKSFELIERHLPDIAEEMKLILHQVVPVGFDRERHLSASYAEAIGTVYMSLHPNLLTMTEALIHEFQHNKLNALLYFDPIIENLESELYASPVRPDPRPLRGVLLAVHAFLPVARLYEKMIEARDPLATSDAERRYRDIVRINREGCEVLLPNARPTPIGRSVLAEIAALHEHFGA